MSSQPDKSLSKTLRRFFALMTALLPAATQHAIALPAVNSLGGGLVGYADGNTYSTALFNTPAGMAADVSGRYLYLADRDNSRIRILDLTAQTTITFPAISTNLIAKPIALSLNSAGNVTVLNRANTTNGSIITFNKYGESIFTNALKLTNATGMALDSVGNIYVTVQSNKIIRLDAGTTNRTTVATVAETGATLQGLTVKLNGMIVVCDSARNGLYQVNPTNGLVTTNAGFHGAGDFVTNNINSTSSSLAKFRQPMNVLEAGDGSLVVSDYGNNRVKVILTTGEVTNLYGISSTYWSGFTPGVEDGSVQIPDSLTPNVQARLPYGLLLGFDGSLYTTEQYYHAIRKVTGAGLVAPPPAAPAAPLNLVATTNFGQVVLTWSSSVGATNYYIKRSFINGGPYTVIASTSALTYTDTNVFNGTTYYYVISASNSGGEGANSTQISARPPLPPVPDPQIGYVDFPSTSVPVAYTSVFHPMVPLITMSASLKKSKEAVG